MQSSGPNSVFGKVLLVYCVAAILACIALPFSAFGADKLIVKDAAGMTTKFVVKDDGKVGVGTAAPASLLHVSGGYIIVDNVGNTGVNAGFSFQNANATFPAAFSVGGVGNPNYLANWNLQTGTQYDLTKISWNIGLNVSNDQLNFQRAPAGGTLTNIMVLKGTTGNLGIGAAVPTQKLEVNGGVRLNTATTQPACDAAARGTFWFTQGASDDVVQVCAMSGGSLKWTTVQRF